jgi:glycerol-3-phosphate dehydrogenase
MRTVVLGAGSWGTAFAKILGDAGNETVLWARRPEIAAAINAERINPDYLPGTKLGSNVTATTSAAEALAGAEIVVIAVPSQTLRANLADWAPDLGPDATLVSLMKGIELGTTMRMSQVITENAGVSAERVAVVSGPNLAAEIAAGQPGERHRVGAQRHAEPARFGQASGDEGGLRVVAQAHRVGDAEGERDDVLHRTTQLTADDVLVGVRAEV